MNQPHPRPKPLHPPAEAAPHPLQKCRPIQLTRKPSQSPSNPSRPDIQKYRTQGSEKRKTCIWGWVWVCVWRAQTRGSKAWIGRSKIPPFHVLASPTLGSKPGILSLRTVVDPMGIKVDSSEASLEPRQGRGVTYAHCPLAALPREGYKKKKKKKRKFAIKILK